MRANLYKITWIIVLLLGASISCNLISAIKEDARIAQGTAMAAITKVEEIATLVEESGMLETAKAIYTASGSEIKSTLEALATEVGESGFLETVQVYITQERSKVESTLEAASTELSESDLLETAQSVITEGVSIGQAPSDIPIVDRESVINFLGSDSAVSYTTTIDLASVLEFYQHEMPINGWISLRAEDTFGEGSAVLHFEKADRKATITISSNPFNDNTVVTIAIFKK